MLWCYTVYINEYEPKPSLWLTGEAARVREYRKKLKYYLIGKRLRAARLDRVGWDHTSKQASGLPHLRKLIKPILVMVIFIWI